MKTIAITFIFCLTVSKANCQKIFEVGIKPTEFAFLNFDTHIGIGTPKIQYGLLLGYRPSTQQSGYAIPQAWNGAGSNYGRRFANKLYTAYTVGLYCKKQIAGVPNLFWQVDAFYRNWHFDKKHAEYKNVENGESSFNGTRTENVDVYCMKILFGKTFYLKAKPTSTLRWYMDVYGGLGARYEQETYQTFDGTVDFVYYSYKKDEYHHIWPSPQVGISVGIVHSKPVANTIPASQN